MQHCKTMDFGCRVTQFEEAVDQWGGYDTTLHEKVWSNLFLVIFASCRCSGRWARVACMRDVLMLYWSSRNECESTWERLVE